MLFWYILQLSAFMLVYRRLQRPRGGSSGSRRDMNILSATILFVVFFFTSLGRDVVSSPRRRGLSHGKYTEASLVSSEGTGSICKYACGCWDQGGLQNTPVYYKWVSRGKPWSLGSLAEPIWSAACCEWLSAGFPRRARPSPPIPSPGCLPQRDDCDCLCIPTSSEPLTCSEARCWQASPLPSWGQYELHVSPPTTQLYHTTRTRGNKEENSRHYLWHSQCLTSISVPVRHDVVTPNMHRTRNLKLRELSFYYVQRVNIYNIWDDND